MTKEKNCYPATEVMFLLPFVFLFVSLQDKSRTTERGVGIDPMKILEAHADKQATF